MELGWSPCHRSKRQDFSRHCSDCRGAGGGSEEGCKDGDRGAELGGSGPQAQLLESPPGLRVSPQLPSPSQVCPLLPPCGHRAAAAFPGCAVLESASQRGRRARGPRAWATVRLLSLCHPTSATPAHSCLLASPAGPSAGTLSPAFHPAAPYLPVIPAPVPTMPPLSDPGPGLLCSKSALLSVFPLVTPCPHILSLFVDCPFLQPKKV